MTFDDYQKQAMSTALDTGGEMTTLYYRALGLTNEAGEVAGKVKKLIRDNQGSLSEESKKAIAGELGDVLWYLQALSDFLGVPLEEIAQANLDKLLSRKERQVLGGSGDNR
jgi:NTP pyrophosphatase (non-canonical NTP hydrolase)